MLTRIKVALQSRDGWKRLYYFVLAGLLFAIPVSIRKGMFKGSRHYCPVCGSHLKRFLVLHRPYHRYCPVCQSLQRHRFLWLYFEKTHFFDPGRARRLLHFAPEACLADQFKAMPQLDYISADLYLPAAMVRMDIARIEFPDQSFELILCSHVLEHVLDDRKALRELYRVLKPGGKAILMVPIIEGPTREDPSILDPLLREKLFGQFDHVRLYGIDFEERVSQAGFTVRRTSTEDIANLEEMDAMGLNQTEFLFVAEKG